MLFGLSLLGSVSMLKCVMAPSAAMYATKISTSTRVKPNTINTKWWSFIPPFFFTILGLLREISKTEAYKTDLVLFDRTTEILY